MSDQHTQGPTDTAPGALRNAAGWAGGEEGQSSLTVSQGRRAELTTAQEGAPGRLPPMDSGFWPGGIQGHHSCRGCQGKRSTPYWPPCLHGTRAPSHHEGRWEGPAQEGWGAPDV
jgi:hypothetical protein